MSNKPYKTPPPKVLSTRPPRLSQITEELVRAQTSTDIWGEFARRYVHDRRRRGYKIIFEACSVAHLEVESAQISNEFQADASSFSRRALGVASLSERLLAALMPERDELVPAGQSTVGIDGLDIGQRNEIIQAVANTTSELWLRGHCVPDLKDSLSRPDGTAGGHPVFGAADPIDVGRLLKQLALVHRRAKAAGANPGKTIWGDKQANTIFLDAIGWHTGDLQPILGAGGKTRYATNQGRPTGWLPEFLRAAEKFAIDHALKGLVSATSDGTIKNVCERAIHDYQARR